MSYRIQLKSCTKKHFLLSVPWISSDSQTIQDVVYSLKNDSTLKELNFELSPLPFVSEFSERGLLCFMLIYHKDKSKKLSSIEDEKELTKYLETIFIPTQSALMPFSPATPNSPHLVMMHSPNSTPTKNDFTTSSSSSSKSKIRFYLLNSGIPIQWLCELMKPSSWTCFHSIEVSSPYSDQLDPEVLKKNLLLQLQDFGQLFQDSDSLRFELELKEKNEEPSSFFVDRCQEVYESLMTMNLERMTQKKVFDISFRVSYSHTKNEKFSLQVFVFHFYCLFFKFFQSKVPSVQISFCFSSSSPISFLSWTWEEFNQIKAKSDPTIFHLQTSRLPSVPMF